MTFGKRLRAEMERRGWDQKALAAHAGITAGAVSRHLDKEDAPRADSLAKYAEALGVSVAWLGYGRTEPAPSFAASATSATGDAALDLVLRDYTYPPDADMVAIDAAEEEARREATTPAGQRRSPAAWRAYMDKLMRRRSDKQTVRQLAAERRR